MYIRRRLSPQQQQENISRKQFGEFLEQNEWVTDDISPDLGEDILVRVYKDGVSTGLSFYTQLKSVDDIEKFITKNRKISYPFEVKDLEHWDAQAVTVILVVWDVGKRQGWWIGISDAIQYLLNNNPEWKNKETVTFIFPSKTSLRKKV
jgi:hypothetical protein